MEKKKQEKQAPQAPKEKAKNKAGKKETAEKYVPPQLIKFDKLEKLIVSGE